MWRAAAPAHDVRPRGHQGTRRCAPARVRGAMALLALLFAAALCGGASGAPPPQRWKLASPDASRDLLVPAPQGLARLAAYDQVRATTQPPRAKSSERATMPRTPN